MQINIKQHEIIDAIKDYIAKKGIDLTSKHVSIDFTAGRKSSGISADISIEEAGIPGFSDENEPEEIPTKVTLAVVAKSDPSAQEGAAESPAAAISEPVEQEAVAEPEAVTAKTNSLFS